MFTSCIRIYKLLTSWQGKSTETKQIQSKVKETKTNKNDAKREKWLLTVNNFFADKKYNLLTLSPFAIRNQVKRKRKKKKKHDEDERKISKKNCNKKIAKQKSRDDELQWETMKKYDKENKNGEEKNKEITEWTGLKHKTSMNMQ